jgi:uncharacterized protein (TIGR03083 family)
MATVTEDLGSAYRDTRLRITELVGAPGVDPSMLVPATPEWTVKDVVAHLAGVCADILAGNLEGIASDPWTAAQVEARRDKDLAECLEEWAGASAEIEPIVVIFPGRSGHQFVMDAFTHEHDLRNALGKPGERESSAAAIALDFAIGSWLHYGVKPLGLPALVVEAGDRSFTAGEGEPVAVLRGARFEITRAVTGRRSVEQIKSLDWSGDPEPYLASFTWGPFRPAASDLAE